LDEGTRVKAEELYKEYMIKVAIPQNSKSIYQNDDNFNHVIMRNAILIASKSQVFHTT
jgi:hypothetical protein